MHNLESTTYGLQNSAAGKAVRRQPKLLFLARPFPPLRAISCVRTWNIAKNLARLGWEVTVVTPHPSIWRDIDDAQQTTLQVEREGIRRILTDHFMRFLEPEGLVCSNRRLAWVLGGVCRRLTRWQQFESGTGWVKAAQVACESLAANDVDVILATGSPFSSFTFAKHLSDKLGRPYVLDYRDPWTDNPYTCSRPSVKKIQQEGKLLKACAAATVVSQSWAEAMAHRFGIGAKLHVITNGYDPEELTDVQPYNFRHFAIVYTGSFYSPKRIITPVMAALKRLKEIRNGYNGEWYFHYYGDGEAHVREEAKRFGVRDRVVLHGIVSRSEALSAVRGAGVAVVITSIFDEALLDDKGMITGKVFEAMGLGTRILLISPPGSDAIAIVEKTGVGRSFGGTDIEGIVDFLSTNIGRTDNKRSNCADKYSWPGLAMRLDRILKDVIAGKTNVTR